MSLCLIKKARKGFVILLMMPIVAFLKLIRPLVRVRFFEIFQERIGHQIAEFQLYQEKKAWDFMPVRKIPLDFNIVFGSFGKEYIANQFVFDLEKRIIFSMRFCWLVDKFCNYLKDFKKIFGDEWIFTTDYTALCYDSSFFVKPPLFSLRPKEVRKGEEELRKCFGYDGSRPIVTFSNRDKAYIESLKFLSGDPSLYSSAHSYRDSSVKNLSDAITVMSNKYFCFRMGNVALEPLEIVGGNIVDYASSKFKSDFLDVYIFARTKFYIGDDSGINFLPQAFRKKMGIINCPIFTIINRLSAQSHPVNNLCIPKKHFSIKENRLLNLSEIVSIFKGGRDDEVCYYNTSSYEKLGIKLIENSPKEILDLTLEVERRVDDDWEEDPEHFRRENEFWKISGAPYKNQNRMFFPRIGYEFLKENEWLVQ